jgi:hypothetical protein
MSDRELLELAAKAAEIKDWVDGWSDKFWNPLTDDGDALRLAVKLGLDVCQNVYGSETWVIAVGRDVEADYLHGDDSYAATRRAIVRAAAEIGKKQA